MVVRETHNLKVGGSSPSLATCLSILSPVYLAGYTGIFNSSICMAKGENASKYSKNGKEWWGKRPLAGYPVSRRSKTNKFFKRLLHKIERREGKPKV